jgi:4-hydroxy-3-methylbut-2-en-1-yl diphosphate synthase IspG/GcpE
MSHDLRCASALKIGQQFLLIKLLNEQKIGDTEDRKRLLIENFLRENSIIGCIVNGPGEMADADFGYVGSKPGMIDLYVGKSCVEKDILFDDAVDRLIALIKSHGRWVEPQPEPVVYAEGV